MSLLTVWQTSLVHATPIPIHPVLLGVDAQPLRSHLSQHCQDMHDKRFQNACQLL